MPACVGTTRLRAAVPALLLSLGLAACDGSSTSTEPLVERAAQSRTPQPPEDVHGPRSAADVATNVSAHSADVTVDTAVTVSVTDGTLSRVLLQAQGSSGRVAGTFDDDRTRWTADELLEPDTDYVVEGRGTDQAGLSARVRVPFRTENLTLPEQTYASIAPLEGEVVGVGMPVIVTFDVPVARRAEFERHLHISSEPATRGSWHWMSDSEVLWRPQAYWEPGTRVHVDLDVNGLDAGNGIYGQMDRSISFSVGRSVVLRADLKSHRMKVFVAGRLARTIPITGGKSGSRRAAAPSSSLRSSVPSGWTPPPWASRRTILSTTTFREFSTPSESPSRASFCTPPRGRRMRRAPRTCHTAASV